MASLLRRAASCQSTFLLRTCLFRRHLHRASLLSFTYNSRSFILHDRFPSNAGLGSSRGFAKGKRSKDNDDEKADELPPILIPELKENTRSQMDAAVVALSRELNKLRTGRASAGMLDHIIVESGGAKMPLSRLAVVSVLDSKTLSVTPYDPDGLKALANAITTSPLGLNPRDDGQRLVAVIPPLTKEHMQVMCKVVSKSGEDTKQRIRRARQKALDSVKRVGSNLSKDNVKRLEKEIDEFTKQFVKLAEDMCKVKEKEITQG